MDIRMTAPGNRTSARKRLVVLTGAGISAESGLSTFRGTDGLWENERVEDVATIHAWRRDPERVHRFYNIRRAAAAKALPNAGHLALSMLESHFEVIVITQNVDDLHEKAGSTHILHLHGELSKARCSEPPYCRMVIGDRSLSLSDTCADGHPLRPDIVWFGEAVPLMDEALQYVSQADVFVIIGTSLNVYPAAGLIHETPSDTPIYYIDPDPNLAYLPTGVTLIRETAVVGTPILAQILIEHHV